MIKVYPIILTPVKIGKKSGYSVYVPDMEINTQGFDMAEAIFMARDAIGIVGISEEDEGRQIAEPSVEEPPHKANETVTWVDIDFDRYRRLNDMSLVRMNVTIPKGLKYRGEEENLNFSGLLQDALKNHFDSKSI